MKESGLDALAIRLMRHNSTARRPWKLLSSEFIKFHERAITADQALFCLIRAWQVRPMAESYRGFNVGVCGIILRQDGMGRVLQHGANIKDAPGEASVDKHAEEFILEAMQPGDFLAAMAVVAPTQVDEQTGRMPITLPPCHKCDAKIEAKGEATASTLIICATPDLTRIQWGTRLDFALERAGQPNSLSTISFKETPPLFSDLNERRGRPIDMADPTLQVDTSQWDAQFMLPIQVWLSQHQYN